uniref:Uncharacterized protein n=1 Tax=Arundo donax TaxID=35708 RepID=A0A0A9FMP6_ARUDO
MGKLLCLNMTYPFSLFHYHRLKSIAPIVLKHNPCCRSISHSLACSYQIYAAQP